MKRLKDILFLVLCFAVIFSIFGGIIVKASWPKWIISTLSYFSVICFLGFLVIFFLDKKKKKQKIISDQALEDKSYLKKGFVCLFGSAALSFAPVFLSPLLCHDSGFFFSGCFLGVLLPVEGLVLLIGFVFLAKAISNFILFSKSKRKAKMDLQP